MVGKTLGHYRIERRIGGGGMGMVYSAEDERLHRAVAIKVIHEGLDDRSLRERFWLEARAAASITHPAVCQVYEVGEHDGRLFIVMELLDGQTLEDRLAYGALDIHESIVVGLAVLDALAVLHRRGLIHRDIKPSNVFLTSDGRVKLLDFGLVRPTGAGIPEGATALTRPGVGIGTPGYMSPEQVLGRDVDARTDVFSVAVVLHEAMTGRRVFRGDNAVEIMNAVLKQKLPPLRGSAAHEQVGQVLSRAAAREPSGRFASAGDMATALRAVRHGTSSEPTVSTPASLMRLAVLPFRMLRPDPERNFLGPSIADAVSLSLTGIGSLVVRSTVASARYASDAPDLSAIQKDLDVDVVLTGTLVTAGDRCRLTAQLVEVPGGDVAWSETIDVSSMDIFELQDTITKRIVESLKLPLTERERVGLAQDVPGSPSAYELFLKANQLARPDGDPPRARDLYVRALEADPHYAPAWARLANCHRIIAKYFPQDRKRNFARSEDALRRAFELRPDFPAASLVKAQLDLDMGRIEQAIEDLLEVVEKNPNDPAGYAGLVTALRYAGFLESSVAAHERVRALDPEMRTSADLTYSVLGRVDAAARESPDPVLTRAWSSLANGDPQEAIRLAKSTPSTSSRPERRNFPQLMTAVLEGDPKARKFLGEQVENFPDPEGRLQGALFLALLGETDAALRWLEESIENGCFYPQVLRLPAFDRIREHQGFQKLSARAEERRRTIEERFGERIERLTHQPAG